MRAPSMETLIQEIRTRAAECLANTSSSHDWDHTLRVHKLCMQIGKAEGADTDILQMAAYLHDIGRPFQDRSRGRVCHAERGAEIARTLLAPYPFPEEKKDNVLHCIRSHRFRGNHHPRTLEARVLFDA
ncbi:MAG: HD domain-containing protein, partial [Deltaproteobacteria bacterium]|nr:HD domain-containing protein [Deltaproteobacteria bacterium]